MLTALRTLAPFVLLVASLTGQATPGLVFLHVAEDHEVVSEHADHHGEAGHDEQGADHGEEHAHEITPATTPRVRSIGVDLALQPFVPVCHEVLGQPEGRAVLLLAPPSQRAGPTRTPRHSILLL